VGLFIFILQGEFHLVILIQPGTQLDKMEGFFAAHLANLLKSAHPAYLCINNICGVISIFLSEGQAKKAQLVFNSHHMRNPFPEVKDGNEVVVIISPEKQNFNLPKLPPHLSTTTQQGEDFKPVWRRSLSPWSFTPRLKESWAAIQATCMLCQDLDDSTG
jgi:hypothetical protein